ncbi:uncharacterized protein LOC134208385 isoform X2 [Armigeres subalbatus]|uniref:uncharacterized protein LOC134208385 isoform X2 n=1 Tax=Armigeres subalbatus TaxID=124917 RepID=UPI002ED641E7
MQHSNVRSSLLVALVLLLVGAALPVDSQDIFKDCAGVESEFYCFGSKIVQNGLKRLSGEKSLKLFTGVEVVAASPRKGDAEAYRSINEVDFDDTSVLGRITRYLTSHEVKINVGEILRKSDIPNVIQTMVKNVQEEMRGEMEARKKDKDGLGMFLMMKVMIAKMMGTLGFGAITALAFKALGVSTMALILAGIIGLKKLAEGDGDHKGRQVIDASYKEYYDRASVERRRRSSNAPYRGWAEETKAPMS